MLLSAKINLILKEQSCKKETLVTCSIGYIKMILALLIEVIALYKWASIIQV